MRIYTAGIAYCSRCAKPKTVAEDVVYCLECGCQLRRNVRSGRERRKMKERMRL